MAGIVGWDIGGAHLKAARLDGGRLTRVVQRPSRLWLGLDELERAITEALEQLGPAGRHVATMTGELADVFADRAEGVAGIAAILGRRLAPLAVYGGRAGWLAPGEAAAHVTDIASANWHASAALAGRHVAEALFVDMGSTTTDLIPIRDGTPQGSGYTDAERLAVGGLVYTGLVRSFLMALGPRAPFAGGWTPLACEHFATSADVHRLLGTLPAEADQMPSADGRDKSLAASRARLARMVGRDAADAPDAAWQALAAWFAEAQLRQITDAAMQLVSADLVAADAPVVGAGVGRHVVQRLADRLGRRYLGFSEMLGVAPLAWAEECAPAVAVAMLAAQEW